MSAREPVTRWLSLAGLLVHVLEWDGRDGAAGAGDEGAAGPDDIGGAPPLLLVHGLGGSTVNWELVAAPLATALRTRVLALDLAGFGLTRSRERPATVAVNAQLLEALLEVVGPAVVVGNSMGGSLGVAVAASRPDLVTSLVLVNAAFPRPRLNFEQLARTAKFAGLMAPRVAEPVLEARVRALGPEGWVQASLDVVLAQPEELDPEIRTRLVDLAQERLAYPEAVSAYAQAGGSLFRYLTRGMARDLLRVEAPVLVMHGALDRLVPLSFARAAAQSRGWRMEELATVGHVPQLEDAPGFVDLVVDWVAQSSTEPSRASSARFIASPPP